MSAVDRAYEAFTGARRADVVRLALRAVKEPRHEHLAISLDKVHHRPGIDTTAVYSLSFSTDDPAKAHPDLVLLVTTADVHAEGSFFFDSLSLRAWRHPHDPRLPALSVAEDAGRARAWLADAGVPVPGAVETHLLSYRPLRRAVVRVDAGERRFYAKMVRPDRSDGLSRRHRLLDAARVGPPVVAEPEAGVILTGRVPGRSLAHALATWREDAATLPAPDGALALLDRLPGELMDMTRRDSWTDRADFHGAAAATALPDVAGEIRGLTRHIQRTASDAPTGPAVPAHGDFYEANVFVSGGRFTRMIDVDAAGPGLREDDLACLLGHLAVLPDLSPSHYARVGEVVQEWRGVFERSVPRAALRVRVAGVILSLVAGTSRAHALARLDLCRAWLYRAENGD